jgi:xanthine dehydrogenase large subunit
VSVSKPLPHDAAELHVRGTARYVDDIPVPSGCLHLAFGLSDEAHGEILSLDLSEARAADGVALALGAGDLSPMPDVSPSAHDEPLLADGVVHHMGQAVFLVAAASHLAARRAARLGQVEIRALPAVLTVEEALAAGDRHLDGGPRIWSRGDAEGAVAAAPLHVEGEIEIGGQEHFYLEGQAALAIPGEGGDMVVHASSQHPTEVQHKVADALGVPMHAVRVEVRRMGGAFGGKESQGNALAVACAVVAARTGRPCRMRYDRDDDFVVTGKRHDVRIRYRAGFDASGRLRAVSLVHLVRCGWSQDLSLPVADRAMLHAVGAYDVEHVRVESHRLRTNTQSATAFRGFGGPQGMLGIERVMDHMAHALGRDPLEVRRANLYADAPRADTRPEHGAPARGPGLGAPGTSDGSQGVGAAGGAGLGRAQGGDGAARPAGVERPEEGGIDIASRGAVGSVEGRAAPGEPAGQSTYYGMPVTDYVLGGLIDDLAERADYRARRAAIAEWNEGQPVLRRGIALTPVMFGISFTLTHLNQAGALVHVYQDGSIHLNHGGTEMGQGLFRKVSQVAAHAFGVDARGVRITATDTAKVPNTSATAASSGTDLNGMAVASACATIRGRIAEFLAGLHQAEPASVVFEGGEVRVGSEAYPFAEAVRLAYANRVSLSATGFYATPEIVWDRERGRGRPFYYFAYGAACTEVVMDRLTGENRILRADILHDVGRSLNPALDLGQIEGGYVQGCGWLTTEELVWDERGRLATHAPSTYKVPACSDRPDVFEVALWDGANREETIHRSKAVGEPPLMLANSAFLALSDAAASYGPAYPALDAPATPERLWRAAARAEARALREAAE